MLTQAPIQAGVRLYSEKSVPFQTLCSGTGFLSVVAGQRENNSEGKRKPAFPVKEADLWERDIKKWKI